MDAINLLEVEQGDLDFLMRTSVPVGGFDLEDCYLLDVANPGLRLESNIKYFQKQDGGFFYSEAFREYLQATLKARNLNLYEDLHARYAAFLEDRNDAAGTIYHLIESGDTEAAIKRAESTVHPLSIAGKYEVVLHIQHLLKDHVAPQTHLAAAVILVMQFKYVNAIALLEKAESQFGNDLINLPRVWVQRATILMEQGEYVASLELLNRALATPFEFRARAQAKRLKGLCEVYLGKVFEGIETLQMSLADYREGGDQSGIAVLLQDLDFAYRKSGNWDNVQQNSLELLAASRELGNSSQLAWALNSLAVTQHQSNEYIEAIKTFEEGIELARNHSLPIRPLCYLMWGLGDVLRDTWQYEQAHKLYIEAMQAIGDGDPYFRVNLLLSLATLERWQSNTEVATHYAREALAIAGNHSLSEEVVVASLHVNLLESGEIDDADAPKHPVALMFLALRDEQFLHQYMVTEPLSLQPFAAEITHTLDNVPEVFMGEAYDLSWMLKKLLAIQNITSNTRAKANVYIRTLGERTLYLKGNPVRPEQYQYDRKAFELLVFVTMNGSVSKQQIAVALWPELDMDKATRRVHVTLARLRGALENIVLYEGKQYSLSPQYKVEIDAKRFLNLCKKAGPLSWFQPEKETLLNQAEILYQSDFMPDVDSEWANSLRHELHTQRVKMLVDLAKCAEKRADIDASEKYYVEATQHAPYKEQIYQQLLRMLVRAGRNHMALSHYNSLATIYQQDLQIQPSSATKDIISAIL
ncbi:MAG: tetratricopeptide repeat protein [Chloroflexota bacterium]